MDKREPEYFKEKIVQSKKDSNVNAVWAMGKECSLQHLKKYIYFKPKITINTRVKNRHINCCFIFSNYIKII